MRILDYLGVWENLPKPPNPIHTIKVAKNFPKTKKRKNKPSGRLFSSFFWTFL